MAFLLFITAFVLSGIAAYYSVIGLIAIFAASALPVAIMGGSLEVAKLVVASWLYRYWSHIPFLMKTYFTSALAVLMIVTSMGIFGFLSKAHIEQGVSTGDVAAQIAVIDEKIKIERDNIENSRALIAQLDGVVNAMTTGQDRTARRKDGSEFVISSAERALSTRRSQAKDRAKLTKEIETAQARIIELQKEKAPIASELRKVEAEVGPIKYVAAMLYGDNPDQNTLERAVRALIILLICVFDPLAVLMLIAANLTQMKQSQWQGKSTEDDPTPAPRHPQPDPEPTKEQIPETKEELEQSNSVAYTPETVLVAAEEPKYEKDADPLTEDQLEQIKKSVEEYKVTPETHSYLFKEGSFHDKPEGWVNVDPQVVQPVLVVTNSNSDDNVPVTEQSKKKRVSKKKIAEPAVEQIIEDKSDSNAFKPVEAEPDTLTEDRINKMIETGDTTGLEAIYKQIVKELGKKNRAKTTHWGPLKKQ